MGVCSQDRERKRQKLADEAADAYIGADLANGGGASIVSPASEEPVKPQARTCCPDCDGFAHYHPQQSLVAMQSNGEPYDTGI